MLSILIPTYNYNCFNLVEKLNKQALEADIRYEIIVIDDCSTSPEPANREIGQLSNCHYVELEKNIGRAKIRNLLASKAQYEYLLFLDCDSEISSDLFLNKYLAFCNEETVVCGGCMYDQEDTNFDFTLRLKYGMQRESRTAKERQVKPYTSFSTFNFLIPKNAFKKIRFDEKIVEYGHEDTLFGYELRINNYSIYQIENPLIHKGLEPSAIFLEKTKRSMENLIFISKQIEYQDIIEEIKVLRTYKKLQMIGLSSLVGSIFSLSAKALEKNLLGNNPSLFLFDLYKLGYICLTDRN